MKMKYNFGMLKGFDIGFQDKTKKVHGILKDVKRDKNEVKFIFDNFVVQLEQTRFDSFRITKENSVVWFKFDQQPKISGLFVYSMYDTYGFPMEMTKEILSEQGIEIDEEGFNILRQLQKEKTKDTFKNKNAF